MIFLKTKNKDEYKWFKNVLVDLSSKIVNGLSSKIVNGDCHEMTDYTP